MATPEPTPIWDANVAEHDADRRSMTEAFRAGKHPRQIDADNSFFPLDIALEVDFADLFDRFEEENA